MNKIFYLFLLATVYAVAEEPSQAFQKMQKYCEKHPGNWEGHYNLGRMYYQNSELENAEKCFSESIQRCEHPEHQESILYNLGNTFFREAEKVPEDQQKIPLLEKSIQNYEGAAALNKNAEDTQHNLAAAKKWLEKLKKKQEQQQNKNQDEQQRKKENNGDSNKEQPKENQQQQEQQPQVQKKAKQQEMQNVLQKEQNNERILPVNFSNNSNLSEDKVLKDW